MASTFCQHYPRSKFTVHFCISSRDDPAYPILEQLISDFPDYDARIFVEEDDPQCFSGGPQHKLGPNPKIRNMSRGYREAKGDIIWIIDCNVWVSAATLGCMVDGLCGFAPRGSLSTRKKYKFVHQLPLVYDVTDSPSADNTGTMGTALEATFLSTSHAKFYHAISTVAVAPCIVGKSNMFRRSHLDALTMNSRHGHSPGIDYFSSNICEDHLIGDLLWKSQIPASVLTGTATEGRSATGPSPVLDARFLNSNAWGNHLLIPNCLAIQPMGALTPGVYIARRTRWLRVRKFTVPLATFVEPGIESFLCSVYGAFGLTTYMPCHQYLGIPRTWSAFVFLWLFSITCWFLVDTVVSGWLFSGATYRGEAGGPPNFKNNLGWNGGNVHEWTMWLIAWLTREALALRIWVDAILGGNEIVWRGRRYRVSMDARVVEVERKNE